MLTPYDWQEGIGHRAQYVESRLEQGAPVLAISLESGVLMFTYRRHTRKLFEVYDQLMIGAIGQQSDVEALRVAAIDFAHQEGYNRSEQDVTIQRVVTALSGSLKRAFSDFNTSPFVARALFAEVGEKPEDDQFYILDYDGNYTQRKRFAYVAGAEGQEAALKKGLAAIKTKGLSVEKAMDSLNKVWQTAFESEGDPERAEGAIEEAVLLERSTAHENRFRILKGESLPDEA